MKSPSERFAQVFQEQLVGDAMASGDPSYITSITEPNSDPRFISAIDSTRAIMRRETANDIAKRYLLKATQPLSLSDALTPRPRDVPLLPLRVMTPRQHMIFNQDKERYLIHQGLLILEELKKYDNDPYGRKIAIYTFGEGVMQMFFGPDWETKTSTPTLGFPKPSRLYAPKWGLDENATKVTDSMDNVEEKEEPDAKNGGVRLNDSDDEEGHDHVAYEAAYSAALDQGSPYADFYKNSDSPTSASHQKAKDETATNTAKANEVITTSSGTQPSGSAESKPTKKNRSENRKSAPKNSSSSSPSKSSKTTGTAPKARSEQTAAEEKKGPHKATMTKKGGTKVEVHVFRKKVMPSKRPHRDCWHGHVAA